MLCDWRMIMVGANIDKEDYKVLITTSGLGQRLGEITNYTNKSLVRVGKKPAISYIVESYPDNIELVVTLGHFGKQVKDFLKLTYPSRRFRFVNIDNYKGPGSSLGYSMLKSRSFLQLPFVYHACDTLVNERIPKPSDNWIGGYRSSNSTNYASYNVVNGLVKQINDKGAFDYDYLHIGLVGINDFGTFWDTLFRLYKKNPNDSTLNDSITINAMLQNGSIFSSKEFNTWVDIGNVEVLNRARQNAPDRFDNLDKVDETIFIFNKYVVKFYYDKNKVEQRVKRSKILGDLVPKIIETKSNFFKYKYSKGEIFSKVVTPEDFNHFLRWSKKRLWKKSDEVSSKRFKQLCKNFYLKKTKKRIKQFLSENKIRDTQDLINHEKVPEVSKLLELIDFNWLSEAEQYVIHGDCILENIIKTKNSFKLIDWRHNFSGLMKSGDIYYDLAKLNHNLTVNHDIVFKDEYMIDNDTKSINCDIKRRHLLVQCQDELFKFIDEEGFDRKKVEILTPIVWLNMSPLHHYPFNIFLYYFGKYNLWRNLKKYQK